MSNTFLTREEIRELTGRAHSNLQVAALSKMGVPFFVNAIGRPVVPRSSIEGRGAPAASPARKAWVPNVLKKK